MRIRLFIVSFLFISTVSAQSSVDTVVIKRPVRQAHWLEKNASFRIQTSAMLQLWSIYSTGFEIYNTTTQQYEQVDDRFNLSFRRARLVFTGEPYPRVKYTVAAFFDQAGRDVLSSGIGLTNKADPAIGLWDAFVHWKISRKTEALNLIAGWFRPQMQRESITSAWTVNSFEKSGSQGYLRRHLVGTGPGRAAGLTLGGILQQKNVGLQYHVGIFNPVTTGYSATSSGVHYSPLLTARTVLFLGEPEMTNYGISYAINKLGQRRGLSLDFNAAYQGQTDLFEHSAVWGPGFLLNWGPWTLDGEWIWMQRSGSRNLSADNIRVFTTHSATGHARLGYTFIMKKFALEPVVMGSLFEGAMAADEQADAKAVGNSSGLERTYDIGLNWYLNGNQLRLMLNYTFRQGDAGDAGPGATVNDYFSQNGIGAIRRGNWLGLGLNAIF